MTSDAWGIDDGYWDIAGAWHEAPAATRDALRAAMGGHADVDDPPPRSRPVWFVRQGDAPAIDRPAELVLEDGTTVTAERNLPPDLPLGYHDLHPNDGGTITHLVITPNRCHLVEGLRAWGLTVQLYAARSRASWGMGDLADLGRLAAWSRSLGAGMIAINPLHAALPVAHQQDSPYFASSRLWRNPLYVRVEDVPGFDAGDPELGAAAAAGPALNRDRLIDRDAVWAAKSRALEHLWSRFRQRDERDEPRFEEFCRLHGDRLRRYGTFCALVELYQVPWPQWPTEHRRPEHPGVERFAAAHADRVRYHCWLQWLIDEQLARAAVELPLVTDLAVGVDPTGFDGWLWQDVFAPGVRVGAPPDEFNPAGQDWGLPPFVPWKLRAQRYEPWVLTLRAAMRHAAAVRIDHVMGLFRLFWTQPGGSPLEGAYVRYPGSELLDVLALESARAGALVVGEDLGTVEPGTRERLAERGVLSTRLVWFESAPPEAFPAQALASISTHDLPTVAGAWTGADAEARRRVGVPTNDEAEEGLRARLAALAGCERGAPVGQVVRPVYEHLAAAPSMLVSATLDDLLEVPERPNLPGTVAEWPNWRLALPQPLEEIEDDPRVRDVAAVLSAQRSGRLR